MQQNIPHPFIYFSAETQAKDMEISILKAMCSKLVTGPSYNGEAKYDILPFEMME